MTDVFTGFGVSIQGHLQILEYKNQEDYQQGKSSRTLLNKRNAVHKDNASIMLVRALANRRDTSLSNAGRRNGAIAHMVFGNGGTSLNMSGEIVFNPPNDTGLGADLYNPTFFKLVDDRVGATPGNQMNVRHISNSQFSDCDLRCLIGVNEPFGQLVSNTQAGINIDTNTFAFDEIGLKLIDGTLITHVTFSPVLKTASSLIEVVYTLRVAIENAPPSTIVIPPVTRHLVGVQATAQVGAVSDTFVACVSQFQWKTQYYNNNNLGILGYAPGIDKFGNLVSFANNAVVILDPSGNAISAMTQNDLADAIDAFHGSAIVGRGTGFNPANAFFVQVINQGNYIITFFTGSDGPAFARWYALMAPSVSGNPTVVGVYWHHAGSFDPPNLDEPLFYETNNQTTADPIMVKVDFGIGGGNYEFMLLPSINDYINNTYAGGYSLGMAAQQIPIVACSPIVNANFSTNLLIQAAQPPGTNANIQVGFTLPSPSGGTNIYFYFNRSCMDNALTGVNRNTELHNVIAPVHPNGAMVKISLGVLNFVTAATLGNFNSAATAYTIDDAHWIDQLSVVQIPFTDEWHYISTGEALGEDAYSMQPGFVLNRGGGKWWVLFYLPGIRDSEAHSNTLWNTVRIFEYNTSTEIATQFFMHSCINYTIANMPADTGNQNDFLQAYSAVMVGAATLLTIRGLRPDIADSLAYATNFCEFKLS